MHGHLNVKYCTSIGNFEGILIQIFLMHQAISCSQSDIKFLLYVLCDKRINVTVSSFHTFASSTNSLSSLDLDGQTL